MCCGGSTCSVNSRSRRYNVDQRTTISRESFFDVSKELGLPKRARKRFEAAPAASHHASGQQCLEAFSLQALRCLLRVGAFWKTFGPGHETYETSGLINDPLPLARSGDGITCGEVQSALQ